MAFVVLYFATLIPFLLIDIAFLRTVMLPLFERNVGPLMADDVKIGVAAAFYLFYVAGIVYFAVYPGMKAGSVGIVVFNGALLGLLAYGTYEATNMATLRGWSWTMVITDVTWGAVLSATSAYLGFMIARGFGVSV